MTKCRNVPAFLFFLIAGVAYAGPVTQGAACLVASGLQNPSSVRIAPAGSGFDLDGAAVTLYVVEFSGAIRRIGYMPE